MSTATTYGSRDHDAFDRQAEGVTFLIYLPRQGWNRVLRVSLDSIYIENLVVLTRAPHSQLSQRLRGAITRRIVLAKNQLVWLALIQRVYDPSNRLSSISPGADAHQN